MNQKTIVGYAFLNLKKPEFKEKIGTDNLDLLLPLTGEKSAAGNLVVNLRYSMLLDQRTNSNL